MEKKEAIREWCVEKAIQVCTLDYEDAKKVKVSDVIGIAKDLEKYITDSFAQVEEG